MKTALYRHFNDAGELLYVGISFKMLNRTKEHYNDKEWFHETVKITIEWYETWELAEQAETMAIINEYPKYNVKRKKKPNPEQPGPKPGQISRSEVIEKIKESNKRTYSNLSSEEKLRRSKLISIRKSGKSRTGKVNWQIVNEIRRLFNSGIQKKTIQQKFPILSIHTINDIINYRTWKNPPKDPLKPQKPGIDL